MLQNESLVHEDDEKVPGLLRLIRDFSSVLCNSRTGFLGESVLVIVRPYLPVQPRSPTNSG